MKKQSVHIAAGEHKHPYGLRCEKQQQQKSAKIAYFKVCATFFLIQWNLLKHLCFKHGNQPQ